MTTTTIASTDMHLLPRALWSPARNLSVAGSSRRVRLKLAERCIPTRVLQATGIARLASAGGVMTLGWLFLPAAVAGIAVAFLSDRAPLATAGSTSVKSSGSTT